MKTISKKVHFPYQIPLVIFGVMAVFHVLLESQEVTDELYLLIGIMLAVTSIAVSVSSFTVSKIYGFSRIFGLSYLILGIGYFFSFLGEMSFIYYVDILHQDTSPILGEISFLAFYCLVLIHMTMNIRYFADGLRIFQKSFLGFIPIVMVLIYSILVLSSDDVVNSEFLYTLVFVSLAAMTVSFAIVGFTMFKQTALMVAWSLLLIGMFVGMIGDFANYYLVALGDLSISNYSTTLWITSSVIMVYALYRHQKSV